jgi:hypothetical protein
MHMRSLLAVLISLTLPGCFPIVASYAKIEAPDARYFGKSCRGVSGPSSVIYYQFHGIFISLDMDSWVRLGLHIPSGVTAQLNENSIRIDGRTETGNVVFSARIKAAKHGSLGNVHPQEFLALPDPFTGENNLGPFNGASKNGRHVLHLFAAVDDQIPNLLVKAPLGLLSGTIELPSMTVNGQRYERQRLQFKRKSYAELSPINC